MEKLKVGDQVIILPSVRVLVKQLVWPKGLTNKIGEIHTIRDLSIEESGKERIYLNKTLYYVFKEHVIKKVKPINTSFSKLQVGDKVVVLPSLKRTIGAMGWHTLDMPSLIGKTLTIKYFDKDKDNEILELYFEETTFFLYEKDVLKV